MGAIATQLADHSIITDDNPRSEEAETIRKAILAACPHGFEIGDRSEAILFAIANAQAGDLVIIAGKGHETGQIIGQQTYAFDDAEQASLAIEALKPKVN